MKYVVSLNQIFQIVGNMYCSHMAQLKLSFKNLVALFLEQRAQKAVMHYGTMEPSMPILLTNVVQGVARNCPPLQILCKYLNNSYIRQLAWIKIYGMFRPLQRLGRAEIVI